MDVEFALEGDEQQHVAEAVLDVVEEQNGGEPVGLGELAKQATLQVLMEDYQRIVMNEDQLASLEALEDGDDEDDEDE